MGLQIAFIEVLSLVFCLAGCTPTARTYPPQKAPPGVDDSNLSNYDRELLRWERDMHAQFERAAAGLSPNARAALEIEFNRNYPTWKHEVALRLRAMEKDDVTQRALQLAKDGDRKQAFDLVDRASHCFTAVECAKLKSRINFVNAQEQLRLVAHQKGWEAAAALISDARFQREMDLSLDQAAKLRQDIGAFLQQADPNHPSSLTDQQ